MQKSLFELAPEPARQRKSKPKENSKSLPMDQNGKPFVLEEFLQECTEQERQAWRRAQSYWDDQLNENQKGNGIWKQKPLCGNWFHMSRQEGDSASSF